MHINVTRYLLIFVATAIGIAVLTLALEYFIQFEVSGGWMPLMPFFFAAMMEGQRHVEAYEDMPSGGDMWRASLLMSLIGMLINAVVGVALYLVFPEMFAPLAGIPMSYYVIGLAGVFVVALVTSRVGVRSGARSTYKLQQKSAKASRR
ncbi:ABZJ_00895 family protein [Actibacterium sp. XHP0104]|uniref:ABZJ_00895 family protein n=1 Tax=Actibacterium sp. XHP0104 TaxID=2984335 RepID=UPI0021E6E80E|nr:ABZJ_00895 family protein [Actibacterium sp. XHP0104]MCV2881609.1 ABZJ_00895 family protein [Actibacterium sp. XHP0104]